MRSKIKFASAIICLLVFAVPVFANDFRLESSKDFLGEPVEPRLLYPISDKVDLSGKDALEFRWMNNSPGVVSFIFKIYKGYNLYASNLIYKEDLQMNASSIKIKSGLFEDGKVYTWVLVAVSISGRKSDKSFDSFKVIKK